MLEKLITEMTGSEFVSMFAACSWCLMVLTALGVFVGKFGYKLILKFWHYLDHIWLVDDRKHKIEKIEDKGEQK